MIKFGLYVLLLSALFSHNEESDTHIFPKNSHAFSHALLLQLPSYTNTDDLTPGAQEIYRMAQEDIYNTMSLPENVFFIDGRLVLIEEEEDEYADLPILKRMFKRTCKRINFFRKIKLFKKKDHPKEEATEEAEAI